MDEIQIIDVIGNCDVNGNAVGHILKTLKEAKVFLNGTYNVQYIVTKDYTKYFNEKNIVKVLEYSFSSIFKSKKENTLLKIKRILAVRKLIYEYEKVWFINTDLYVYIGILLSFSFSKKIFTTNYIDYLSRKGIRSKVEKVIYQLAMKRIKYEFTTSRNRKGEKYRVIPDYPYIESKYQEYLTNDVVEKVYMCGLMSDAKEIDEAVGVFIENGQPLEIFGKFNSKIQFEHLKSIKTDNVVIKDIMLDNDEYYRKIAESKFILLPYKSENYSNRSSGVILESIYLNSIVIAPNFLLDFLGIKGLGYDNINELSVLDLSTIQPHLIEEIRNQNRNLIKKFDVESIKELYCESFK